MQSELSVAVSLDPVEEAPERSQTLGELISRITQERGSFAALDEQQLASQTESGNNSPTNEDAAGASSNETKSTQIQEEDVDVDLDDDQQKPDESAGNFEELRGRLAAQVGAALNETALNLDFVSLLVSASRPQAGESSMSPMLKSQTPIGSLNAESIAAPAPAALTTSGYGWKVRAFKQSAENMASSFSRLVRETQKDARFWRDLLETTSHGEVVNRKLRVTYGFHDSGSNYFDRGTGTFVRDEESGRAVLKPTTPLVRKLLQVSVYADNSGPQPNNISDDEIGSTKAFGDRVKSSPTNDNSDGLESSAQTPEPNPRLLGRSVLSYYDLLRGLPEPLRSVRVARNNLFEHELMYQLIQEARGGLAAHRVKLLDGGKIVCELFGGRIELELIEDPSERALDKDTEIEAELETKASESTLPLSNPAVSINFALHLLLTELYRAEFNRKHTFPDPLNSNTRPCRKTREAVLLPVLARVHHSILVARTLRLVQVMIPQAEISSQPANSAISSTELVQAPQCLVIAQTPTVRVTLDIRSPISDANEPMAIVSTQSKKTEIYDLTELELWLRWVTK